MSSIVCSCGKRVEPQPEWAGQWIVCPGCAGSLYSPFPGPKPSTPSVAAAPGGFEEFPSVQVAAEPTRLCPLCAETISAADPKCRFCGGSTSAAPAPPPVRPAPPPAPAQVGDGGVASLIVSLVGYMFCGLLCPIGWLLASNYEAACRRQGVEPAGAGKAGKIIGIIGTIFLLLAVGFFVLSAVVG